MWALGWRCSAASRARWNSVRGRDVKGFARLVLKGDDLRWDTIGDKRADQRGRQLANMCTDLIG